MGADVVVTPEQCVERLIAQSYDVVVAEYPGVDHQGTQALELLQHTGKQIPLIFLTETLERETVAELTMKGAADCIEKDRIGRLPVAIRRALEERAWHVERDQVEKKLRHSEAQYRALVDNLIYGVCRCGLDGRFQDVNQALVTMLGYASREELLAVDLARGIIEEPGRRARLLGNSGEGDRADPVELEWKRKDGSTLKVRLSGREVSDEHGEHDGYEMIIEDITKQRKLEDQLRHQANTDSLTGLANYGRLFEVLSAEIHRSARTGREFALLLLDLDGLKWINDEHGHQTGSQALCRLADVLSNCSRSIDTAARFGGDEFALVLPETGAGVAQAVARRICESLANDGREPRLSVSAGVAAFPRDAKTVATLLYAADRALYARKREHINFVSLASGL
jgi:diguanylate cyclase (GGDEF)-like protein/PAS domain S-box-containing protein